MNKMIIIMIMWINNEIMIMKEIMKIKKCEIMK